MPGAKKRLLLTVRRFLQDPGITGIARVAPGQRLVVGFSGGVDSMALAQVLVELGFVPVLAHLDHGLRSESAADATRAAAHAAQVKLPFVTSRIDVAALAATESCGLEDAGRRARYTFLETVRREHGADWIALGHQADDLVEDVLLRLVRGAGWPALGGMTGVDPARHLLRPLLHIPRVELEAYLQSLGLQPIEDESNAGLEFRRNRLRHSVVPHLRAENPSLHRAVSRLHELAFLDADYWDTALAPLMAHVEAGAGSVLLPESILLPLHPALRLRLYTRLLAELGGLQPRAETLFALDKALFAPQRPKVFEFPGGFSAVLRNGQLLFRTG